MGCGGSKPNTADPTPAEKATAPAAVAPKKKAGDAANTVLGKPLTDVTEDYNLGKVLGRGQFGTTRLASKRDDSRKLYACKSISKDVTEDYNLGKVLGRGQFGTTRLASKRDDSRKLYACKSISKRKLTHPDDIEDVRREIQIMYHLNGHNNGSYEDRQAVHLGTYSEKDAAAMIRTIVDLKPENFLLDSKEESAALKCTDFGLSVYFKPGERFRDVVLRRSYGPEADIWSCGVILYILLSSVPPFWGETEDEVFKSVLKGKLDLVSDPWPQISEEAKDCVRRMLEVDPSKVIAGALPTEEIAGLAAMFKAIDADGSGTITAEELREALKKKGSLLKPEELQGLLAMIDMDANGTIDYEEFIAATMSVHQMNKQDNLAFKHFDTDDSGTISRDELKEAFKKQYQGAEMEAEINKILDEVDRDGNGEIDYEEFVAMMIKVESSNAAPKKGARGELNPYKASRI
eukprot:scaffold4.g4796.t1